MGVRGPFPRNAFDKAIRAITGERMSAHNVWGIQRHGMEVWNLVLTKETGEFAQAVLALRQHLIATQERGLDPYPGAVVDLMQEIRAEAAQVAAVAAAIIENLDEDIETWQQKEKDQW